MAAQKPMTPLEVAIRYRFPYAGNADTGKGQKVAVLAIGGVPDILQIYRDLQLMGVEHGPLIGCLHGPDFENLCPDGSSHGTGEVQLDCVIIGQICPAVEINIYWLRGSTPAELAPQIRDAVVAAAEDGHSVITITFGAPEDDWSDDEIEMVNGGLKAAAQMNATICVASGDDGSSDTSATDRQKNRVTVDAPQCTARVDFPGSSPWVLCVGGTQFTDGSARTEGVWNRLKPNPKGRGYVGGATGGGVSTYYPRSGPSVPHWQWHTNAFDAHANFVPTDFRESKRGPNFSESEINLVPKTPDHSESEINLARTVPDVAALADFDGYLVYEYGNRIADGGTSAAAPLWAALIVIINQSRAEQGLKPVGFINPSLYWLTHVAARWTRFFNDITQGNNKLPPSRDCPDYPGYSAKVGYDACTGWGTPRGNMIQDYYTWFWESAENKPRWVTHPFE